MLRAAGGSLTVDTNGVPLDDCSSRCAACRADALRGVQVPSYPQTIDGVSYVVLDNGGGGLFTALRDTRVPEWAAGQPALGQPAVSAVGD